MNIKDRIAKCNSEITKINYQKEINEKQISKALEIYNKFIQEASEETKTIIQMEFPELLDVDYVNGLDKLSYPDFYEFTEKLYKTLDILMKTVEEALL